VLVLVLRLRVLLAGGCAGVAVGTLGGPVPDALLLCAGEDLLLLLLLLLEVLLHHSIIHPSTRLRIWLWLRASVG
jgi:hypothetical protein